MNERGSVVRDATQVVGAFYRFAAADLSFADLLNAWEAAIDQDEVARDPDVDLQAEQAVHVLDRLPVKASERSMADMIGAYDHPAALLSTNGRLIAVNQAAEATFAWTGGSAIWEIDQNRPGAITVDDDLKERLSHGDGVGVVGFLEAAPIGDEPSVLMAITHVSCAYDAQVAYLVTGLAPVWRNRTLAALQSHFKLTDTELAVVQELVIGGDAAGVARRRGTRLATIRAQIRSILQKTGFESQLDLLRHMGFVLRLDPQFSPALDDVKTPVSGLDGQTTKIVHVLNDGRRLDASLLGPPDGEPVLFLHGIIDCVEFPAKFITALNDRNIRLIAPIRPGYASSDKPRPGPLLENVSDDVFDFLDGLAVKRFKILGHMAGSLYGLVMAGRRPECVTGLVGAAGAAPMVHRWQFDQMSRGHRLSGRTSILAPRVLRLLAKAGLRMLEKKQDDEMIDLYFRDSPKDAALATDPEVRAMILRRFHAATAQGVDAFCADVGLVSRDWNDLMTSVRCPVVMVHGRHDNVVIIDGVRLFVEAHENVRLVEHAEAGQLILTQSPEMILDEVSALSPWP